MPDEPEAIGLLALMLLQDARREARVGASGELILLADQDRIALGPRTGSTRAAGWSSERSGCSGPARTSSRPRSPRSTMKRPIRPGPTGPRWWSSTGLLARIAPSPIVELNLAVAIAFVDGPAAGLARIDDLVAAGQLADYPYLHAARADLLRRLDRRPRPPSAYRRAADLVGNAVERRFLERRLREVSASA